MNARVKPAYRSRYIAFGKVAKPLGQREDINELAIAALQSGDKSLLELFEYIPPMEQLLIWRLEQRIKDVKKK